MNTISQIKQTKKDVALLLSNNDIIRISYEAYLSSYLYEGKQISEIEIKKLIEISEYAKALNYALGLLKKKFYTESEMINKLLKKTNKASAKKIVNKLIEQSLICDEMLLEDLLELYKEKHYGQYKVIQDVKKKGFKESLIKTIVFDKNEQLESCRYQYKESSRKIKEEDKTKKNIKIYSKLSRLGFSSEIIQETMNIKEN